MISVRFITNTFRSDFVNFPDSARIIDVMKYFGCESINVRDPKTAIHVNGWYSNDTNRVETPVVSDGSFNTDNKYCVVCREWFETT